MSVILDLNADHYKSKSKSQYAQAQGLLDSISISPEAYILDIGCGHGKIISELSKKAPYGKSIGIDPSRNMIELAIKLFSKNQYKNLEFFQKSAEKMNFSNNYFDLIVCTNVLMWIRNPKYVLETVAYLLKPGGQFVLFSYAKDTEYVKLFERVLNQNFPELKDQSAVNTMLSPEQHIDILVNNNMSLIDYKLEDVVFNYKDETAFEDYINGWLACYVPLSIEQQKIFLRNIIIESKNFRINKLSEEIAIPHKTISIIATKK